MRLAFLTSRVVVALTLLYGTATVVASEKTETSHLAFVNEYVRELAAIEEIRDSGEKELKRDGQDSAISNMVHSSTLFQLELRSQIAMLKSMRLESPFEELIPNISAFYARKLELWQRMNEIGTAFMAGPKPGIDYGQLGAELPKIRAELEYLDHALFEATPLIFSTLINAKPDSKNHASHLIITKAERTALIEHLNTRFGKKLDQKDQNYTVSAASVLRAYLLKDFKNSDDPWE